MRMKAVENFKWYVLNDVGGLVPPDCEKKDYDGFVRTLENNNGFDTERDAVNALMEFCDSEYRSDEYILIKSYQIRGDY